MLIPFSELIRKYNIHPRGVLHVGGSLSQEAEDYYTNGVEKTIWIEAIPERVGAARDRLYALGYSDWAVIEACVSDKSEEVTFNITNNFDSSSFLELGTHLIAHPEIYVVEKRKMKTERIDSMFPGGMLDGFTFLNLDLQGVELKALIGMGQLLTGFDSVYTEVNKDYLYKGCALQYEIEYYLNTFGFVLKQTEWAGNTGWGDAFYLKEDV